MKNTINEKPIVTKVPPKGGYEWDLREIDRLIKEIRRAEQKERKWMKEHQTE